MVDLRDIPIVGSLIGLGASALDLLLNGGALLLGLIDGLLVAIIGSPASLVSLLSVIERLASRIGLPTGTIELALTLALAVLATIYALRFVERIRG
jgi:hypothetical protein